MAGLMKNTEAAPDLVPSSDFSFANANNADVSTINVVDDFQWTNTPKSHRQEVPFIRMSEYRVNFNSLMMNLRYFLSIGTDRGKLAGFDAGAQLTALNAKMTAKKALGAFTGTKLSGVEKVKDAALGAAQKAVSTLSKNMIKPPQTLPDYLRPYYGLYGATTSGFEYYFPYFEASWKETSTGWTDTKGGGLFQFIFDQLGDSGLPQTILDTAAVDQNVLAAYIERPKMYDYSSAEGREYSFTFTLLNTDDTDDVIRNWHLVFMLAYQNLPNRTSKTQLEPPVIYEIEVPGQFYSPFAYIKGLQVKNLGAQRRAEIAYRHDGSAEEGVIETIKELESVDSNPTFHKSKLRGTLPSFGLANQGKVKADATGTYETKHIETIIPDAYEITVNVSSLIPESKNLFWHSANKTNSIYQVAISDNKAAGSEFTQRDTLGAGNRLKEIRGRGLIDVNTGLPIPQ